MRIAVVHSFYASGMPSGENVVSVAQVEALRHAGHQVQFITQETDERQRRATYPIEAGLTVATGYGPTPLRELNRFRPEVVHVHNLFPNFGTHWLHKLNVPLVATLHNYRPMCSSGNLLLNGEVCTKCPDGERWSGVRHGCYRGSRLATLPIAWKNRNGVVNDEVVRSATAIIVLSQRSRSVYEGAGVRSDKLRLIPNFVNPQHSEQSGDVPELSSPRRWLFAGLLSDEKGVLDLISSWPNETELHVVGDGPDRELAEALAGPNIQFLGRLSNTALRGTMKTYLGLVVASKLYENLPTVYLEALEAGLPVIARDGNSVADEVKVSGVGKVVPREFVQSDMREAIRFLSQNHQILGRAARKLFEQKYTRARWIDAMELLYREVIA